MSQWTPWLLLHEKDNRGSLRSLRPCPLPADTSSFLGYTWSYHNPGPGVALCGPLWPIASSSATTRVRHIICWEARLHILSDGWVGGGGLWGRAGPQHWEQEQEKEVETNQGLGVRVEGTQYNIYPVSLFHHVGRAMWRAVTPPAHGALQQSDAWLTLWIWTLY